jgi:hypothetical protein
VGTCPCRHQKKERRFIMMVMISADLISNLNQS